MDLSIIIVNYQSKTKLANCLASIFAAPLTEINYEIIVIENNSHDDLSALTKQFNFKLINSPKNLGMGGGNNLGIASAAGEYILILNPDTVIKDRAINVLLNYLKNNSSVGIVGPKILYPDASLQFSCARFPTFFMPILRRTFLGNYFADLRDNFTMNDFDHNSIKPVDWLMGSCLMFKKQLVLTNGQKFNPQFDERYFMYFEDIDLCRSVWTKGFKVVYNPEAVVIHDHQRDSARHPWYIALFKDKITWIHIASWFKYFIKWGLFSSKKYV